MCKLYIYSIVNVNLCHIILVCIHALYKYRSIDIFRAHIKVKTFLPSVGASVGALVGTSVRFIN